MVSAVNSAGESGNSNQASATPQLSLPPAPTGLTATAGNAQVSLSWNASPGATSYNVYRSQSTLPGTFECLASDRILPAVHDPEVPASETLFAYLVTTVDPEGQEGTLGRQAERGTPAAERPHLAERPDRPQ